MIARATELIILKEDWTWRRSSWWFMVLGPLGGDTEVVVVVVVVVGVGARVVVTDVSGGAEVDVRHD